MRYITLATSRRIDPLLLLRARPVKSRFMWDVPYREAVAQVGEVYVRQRRKLSFSIGFASIPDQSRR